MDNLQMGITCVLFKVMFELSPVVAFCPSCEPGYYQTRNCSKDGSGIIGIKCRLCTECSANQMETLHMCTKFTDSVCGDRINTTDPQTPPPTTRKPQHLPDDWSRAIAIYVPVGLVFLLLLVFTWLCCKKKLFYKYQKPLPPKCSPETKVPPLLELNCLSPYLP
ncbi:uncharacterized protein LOC121640058 [Melanotaenia boesemani]|uniref:uncharacterized protein LOC121640058 n=1 Tax=Melanotaenia boesemani TaxID=1250792 RepID=UPI001C04F924|nr:uncharacterized protein LOC121640058 [Melanotaenia boesemani]